MGVNECHMTKRAMDFLYIKKVAWVARVAKVIKETVNTFMELETFLIGKADEFPGNIPQISDEDCQKGEEKIPFLFMPRDPESSYHDVHKKIKGD